MERNPLTPFTMTPAPTAEDDDVNWLLNRVEGALMLGMVAKACTLLEGLSPAGRTTARACHCLQEVARITQNWPVMAEMAQRLSVIDPKEPGHRIQWAYATRRAESLEAAEKILLDTLKAIKSPGALVHYNLACYACCRGDLDTGWKRLLRALALEPWCAEMAESDEDLVPLRERLAEWREMKKIEDEELPF